MCFIIIFITFLLIFTFIPEAETLKKELRDDIIEKNFLKFKDIEYSTFIGGFGYDWGMAIATDDQESAFVTGFTRSIFFPIKKPFDKSYNFLGDVFVTKLTPSGKSLNFSTFIGGNNSLVAPVTLHKNSYTAAGSVITDDVPENSLGIARARQINKNNYKEKIKKDNNDDDNVSLFIAARALDPEELNEEP